MLLAWFNKFLVASSSPSFALALACFKWWMRFAYPPYLTKKPMSSCAQSQDLFGSLEKTFCLLFKRFYNSASLRAEWRGLFTRCRMTQVEIASSYLLAMTKGVRIVGVIGQSQVVAPTRMTQGVFRSVQNNAGSFSLFAEWCRDFFTWYSIILVYLKKYFVCYSGDSVTSLRSVQNDAGGSFLSPLVLQGGCPRSGRGVHFSLGVE